MGANDQLVTWLKERLDRLEDKVDAIREDVITLKVKAGLWGGAAGSILGAGIAFLVNFLSD